MIVLSIYALRVKAVQGYEKIKQKKTDVVHKGIVSFEIPREGFEEDVGMRIEKRDGLSS